jgi:ribosomal protein S27AE
MPYSEFTKRSLETVQAKQKRCPKCGATALASATFCGDDGTPLVDA